MSKIIGHQRVKKILYHAIVENKVASAYLFSGIEGIGKDGLAFEFAQTLNCSNPVIKTNSIEPCHQCRNCKQFDKLAHANLDYLFSIPSGGADSKSDNPLEKLTKSQVEDIKKQIEAKAKNPYHKITIEKANQIRIVQVRQIKNKLSRSGNASTGRRVVIVSHADEMTTEAANAFLKTLEEPPENITIILTTSRPDSILQTIHSRTQEIYCSPLPDDLIVEKLLQDVDCSQAEARIAAALGQGSYTTALESLTEENMELRNYPIQLLRISFKKNYYRTELLKEIDSISKYDKKEVIQLLSLMLFWLRDVSILTQSGNENNVINLDQLDIIKKFSAAYGKNDISCGIKIIEEAIGLVPRNVNVRLILISMFIKLRAVFLFGKEEFQIK